MTAGENQIDRVLVRMLRALGPEEWLTAREASSRTMLSLESASRSLVRLAQTGRAAVNAHRPRGYRWRVYPIEFPQGFSLGEAEQLLSPHRYPDGTVVQVALEDDGSGALRVTDGGGARLRLDPLNEREHAVRLALERFALENDLVVEGGALLEAPASTAAADRVARASAEAVETIRIARPS